MVLKTITLVLYIKYEKINCNPPEIDSQTNDFSASQSNAPRVDDKAYKNYSCDENYYVMTNYPKFDQDDFTDLYNVTETYDENFS